VAWLAGTWPPDWSGGSSPRDPWQALRLVQSHWPGGTTQHSASTWYQRGVRADDGSYLLLWDGVGSARGSVALTVRQSALEDMGRAGRDAAVLALLGDGLRPSRVDIAADARGSVPRPDTYFARLRAGHASTRTRPASWVLTVNGHGLGTLTIGSRSSPRYGRIYDKPDELGWRVRHELECKADLAVAIGKRLLAGETAARIWSDEYGRLVQWL